jgi:hypothetical protein
MPCRKVKIPVGLTDRQLSQLLDSHRVTAQKRRGYRRRAVKAMLVAIEAAEGEDKQRMLAWLERERPRTRIWKSSVPMTY